MNPNRKIEHHLFSRFALPTLLLAATALPGWAQGDTAATLPRIEVIAPSIGVHAVCPEFKADMLKALTQVAMRYREPGLLDVNFSIDGQHIGDATVSGGPFEYRRATQRAVRTLECNNGSGGQQSVQMQVLFKDL